MDRSAGEYLTHAFHRYVGVADLIAISDCFHAAPPAADFVYVVAALSSIAMLLYFIMLLGRRS